MCVCLCLCLHSFPSAPLIFHDQTSEKPSLILATFSLIHCVPCDLVSVLNTTETVFFLTKVTNDLDWKIQRKPFLLLSCLTSLPRWIGRAVTHFSIFYLFPWLYILCFLWLMDAPEIQVSLGYTQNKPVFWSLCISESSWVQTRKGPYLLFVA